MPEIGYFRDPAGLFALSLPPRWIAETDPEAEGVEISRDEGAGSLHLLAFAHTPEEFPDPAEELYAFLQEQGVELEEDEVEDLPLEGGAELALCEYLAEDEEEGEESFCIAGVATGRGILVFVTYACAAGEEEQEREALRQILASLRLNPEA